MDNHLEDEEENVGRRDAENDAGYQHQKKRTRTNIRLDNNRQIHLAQNCPCVCYFSCNSHGFFKLSKTILRMQYHTRKNMLERTSNFIDSDI